VDGHGIEANKIEFLKFDQSFEPEDLDLRYSKDGGPEKRIKWLMGYRDIEARMSFKEPLEKTKMLHKLLKEGLGLEGVELPGADLLKIVARDVGFQTYLGVLLHLRKTN
jgi:hypothetical protein